MNSIPIPHPAPLLAVKSSSLSDLRAAFAGPRTAPAIEPAIEKELQTLMGTIVVDLKGT